MENTTNLLMRLERQKLQGALCDMSKREMGKNGWIAQTRIAVFDRVMPVVFLHEF